MSADKPKSKPSEDTRAAAPRRRRKLTSRRRLFAWGATLATAGVLVRRAFIWHAPDPTVHVVVNERCVGCTACAVVCPTDAIQIVPGGIRVIQQDCVSCGYCQAGCTVDGIRVVSETSDG